MENTEINQAGKRIPIRTKSETAYIKPEQLTHLTCDGYLSTLHCYNGVSMRVARLLKRFEALLKGHGFIRVNHNTLVNITYIEKSNRMERYTLHLSGGHEVTVSRRKSRAMKEFLAEIIPAASHL